MDENKTEAPALPSEIEELDMVKMENLVLRRTLAEQALEAAKAAELAALTKLSEKYQFTLFKDQINLQTRAITRIE